MVATIDLGKRTKIREVEAGFVQDSGSWIFLPRSSVEIAVSDDGKDFRTVRTEAVPVHDEEGGVLAQTVRLKTEKVRARFIRVTAVSIHTCPEDHSSAGQKAWLFADEIVVR